jgi:hypothetical protein
MESAFPFLPLILLAARSKSLFIPSLGLSSGLGLVEDLQDVVGGKVVLVGFYLVFLGVCVCRIVYKVKTGCILNK